MEMKEEDYWFLVDDGFVVNGMNLDMILDKLGEGYKCEDVDWERVGRMFREKGLFSEVELKFMRGVIYG